MNDGHISDKKLAFLGIGLMGLPMARNLLRAGFQVAAWNRTKAKAAALAEDGAVICDLAEEAVKGADFVILMVSDGPAVHQLLFEKNLSASLKKGAIVIDMSSIKAKEARRHAAQLAECDIGHLDAPVSGGTKGAEAASLAIMVGGEIAHFDAAHAVFTALGRAVHVGPAGAGQLSKLANQAIVGVTIGIVAEAMLFLEKGGADPAAVRQALQGGFADSTILQQHGTRMTTQNYTPGGTSKTQVKDMDNVLDEGDSLGLTLPLTKIVRDRYVRLVEELDGGAKDHAALYLELCALNGLSKK